MAYIVPKEMPKSCCDCPFSYLAEQHPLWSDEKEKRGTKTLCCQAHAERRKIVLDINDKTTKASWCPLVDASDSVEEKNREWQLVYNENHHLTACKCSACGKSVFEHAKYIGYIYCPYCSTKLDGKP